MNDLQDYTVECPSFDSFLNSGGASGKRYAVTDYAVSIDAGVIRILNNPVLNRIFNAIVNASTDLSYGAAVAEGIRITPDNYPSLYRAVDHCVDALQLEEPRVYISPMVQGMNAMTIGSDKEALVELGSLLASRMSEGELRFVIGHELGHIAMGHVVYHSVLNTVHTITDLIPLVGDALYQMINYPLQGWFRRSELTADRAGLLCCRDLETAQRALLQVSAGFLDAGAVKIDDYIRDSREQVRRSALSRLGELRWNHPITTRRLEALRLFASSEKYYRLAWLPVPEGQALLNDEELERQTEHIVQVIGA